MQPAWPASCWLTLHWGGHEQAILRACAVEPACGLLFCSHRRAANAAACSKCCAVHNQLRDRHCAWACGHCGTTAKLCWRPQAAEHTLLRRCESCGAAALQGPANVRAEGDEVDADVGWQNGANKGVWLAGRVTLIAHGETVTLQNPITITARAGVLSIVVTLPIENYVERVVASESGSADSGESLKALAIVVRTFALHESPRARGLRSLRLDPLPASALERES